MKAHWKRITLVKKVFLLSCSVRCFIMSWLWLVKFLPEIYFYGAIYVCFELPILPMVTIYQLSVLYTQNARHRLCLIGQMCLVCYVTPMFDHHKLFYFILFYFFSCGAISEQIFWSSRILGCYSGIHLVFLLE